MTRSAKYARFVLTDPSLTSGAGGIGGVPGDTNGDITSWFLRPSTANDVQYFMKKGRVNAIAELEALAVLVAIRLRCSKLFFHNILFSVWTMMLLSLALSRHIATRMGFCALVKIATKCLEEAMIFPWCFRVASASDVSDYHPVPNTSNVETKADGAKLTNLFDRCQFQSNRRWGSWRRILWLG